MVAVTHPGYAKRQPLGNPSGTQRRKHHHQSHTVGCNANEENGALASWHSRSTSRRYRHGAPAQSDFPHDDQTLWPRVLSRYAGLDRRIRMPRREPSRASRSNIWAPQAGSTIPSRMFTNRPARTNAHPRTRRSAPKASCGSRLCRERWRAISRHSRLINTREEGRRFIAAAFRASPTFQPRNIFRDAG